MTNDEYNEFHETREELMRANDPQVYCDHCDYLNTEEIVEFAGERMCLTHFEELTAICVKCNERDYKDHIDTDGICRVCLDKIKDN